MEEQEMNASPSRKTSRVEQVVGRWLRRSRDNSHRERTPGDGSSNNRGNHQVNFTIRLTVHIHKDLLLDSYGFEISAHHPIMIKAVAAGGPAERRLVPGDQILKINSVLVDDLSGEQAAEIIRESKESIAVTVLRYTSGPKSSFITAEKRAKLKSNPFKVRFAEEVIVNGHAQGNSLLFLPNVLKVYLENGQTKAFKFEKKTTVKDIVLTLKEKLSIRCIEHFALALEEQYNISRLYLLHDDECIEQVVQKKESHDYRCLFRVCFVPRDPLDLLQEDPVAFEYLFLQSCSDVLHERFAMEMKCNVALRLAALHIQERIHTCGQPQKLSLKYIEKDWGIENFISSTLLRNMKVKDLKKAISFHMKQNQSLLEPRQKQLISAAQARLNYLKILGELKTYGGKTFSATLMLQDRESFVTLLVGAKYGISQIINNKLNILTTLTEFKNISQVELNPESEKVSMVKIYLQDIKPITLLMESHAAKDLACLIAGYYKLFVDSRVTVFTWTGNSKIHRISAEEGYESRGCSDSEESSDIDSSQEILADFHTHKTGPEPFYRVEEDEEQEAPQQSLRGEGGGVETGTRSLEDIEENAGDISEASDSCRTESREDSRINLSFSSDSIDALEEDDLVACSSSWPEFLQLHDTYLFQKLQQDNQQDGENEAITTEECPAMNDTSLCCSQHSEMARSLTEQPKALHDQPSLAEQTGGNDLNYFTFDSMFTFEEDTMQYYNLCANITPDSALDKNLFTRLGSSNPAKILQATTEQKYTVNDERETLKTLVDVMILEPPPGFGDCSSDEEFFDAPEKLTPTDTVAGLRAERAIDDVDICSTDESNNALLRTVRFSDIGTTVAEREEEKKSKKRRSFLETDYTSQVSFPSEAPRSKEQLCYYKKEALTSHENLSLTTSSLRSTEGEPAFLETKLITQRGSQRPAASKKLSSELMEMEPDTMETKSVTESLKGMSSILAIRCQSDPEKKEGSDGKAGDMNKKLFLHHMFTSTDDGQANFFKDDNMERAEAIHTEWASESVSPTETNKICTNNSLPCKENESERVLNKYTKTDTNLQGPVQNVDNGIGALVFTDDTFQELKYTTSPVDDDQGDEHEQTTPSFSEVHYQTPLADFCSADIRKGVPVSHDCLLQVGLEASPESCITSELNYNFNGVSGVVSRLSTSTVKNKIQRLPLYLSKSRETIRDCINGSPRSQGSGSSPKTEQPAYERSQSDSTADCTISEVGAAAEDCPDPQSPTMMEDKSGASTEFLAPAEGHLGKEEFIFLTHHDFELPESSLENVEPNMFSGTNTYFDFPPLKTSLALKSKLEACDCQTVYANCFSRTKSSFDDEITVFEYSCKTSVPLTMPPSPSSHYLAESPLLSPSATDHSDRLEDTLNQLRNNSYGMLQGFSQLQSDILELMRVLKENPESRGQHHKETCAVQFSENKHLLFAECRKLMSSCQKVIRVDQRPEDMLQMLSGSFQTLVHLASVCLWFTNCIRCRKRHNKVLSSLREIVSTYKEFTMAAEKACGRSCHDLAIKLLARQCTALTAKVFCLTQLFRTLTSL
ncbi:FERM and PDZ domain-containing protein 1 [Polyodon spathula]|uniref:FERM and PDZ domain-containing protein 1 n=1 Tax=Polyodon spathula TaxID=7913 RepID=UPI001B7F149A|nr:FERM and PDZ domain-containing protein 1 [Polyodon spathula]